MLIAKATVLTFEGNKSFVDPSGKTVNFSQAMLRLEGAIVRMSVVAGLDLTSKIDKEVSVELGVKAGNNNTPKLSIIGVK